MLELKLNLPYFAKSQDQQMVSLLSRLYRKILWIARQILFIKRKILCLLNNMISLIWDILCHLQNGRCDSQYLIFLLQNKSFMTSLPFFFLYRNIPELNYVIPKKETNLRAHMLRPYTCKEGVTKTFALNDQCLKKINVTIKNFITRHY